jgi:hypothetical protein
MPPRVQTATTPTHGQITVSTTLAWQIVSTAIVPLLYTMQVRAPHVTIHPIGLMPGSSILMEHVQTVTKLATTGLGSAATAIRAHPHGKMMLFLIILAVIRTATHVTLATAQQDTPEASAQNATPQIPGA